METKKNKLELESIETLTIEIEKPNLLNINLGDLKVDSPQFTTQGKCRKCGCRRFKQNPNEQYDTDCYTCSHHYMDHE